MPHNTLIKIGDRFGKLVVIDTNGKDKFNYFSYKVKCDCGNEKNYRSNILRNRKCCGCTICRRPPTSKNLTNEIIEDILVIKESHIGKSGHVYYNCECKNCKSKLKLSSNRLIKMKKEKIKKCKNCMDRSGPQIINLVGLKIGKITISKLFKIVNGSTIWEGVCECGNTRVFYKSQINKAIKNNQNLCCHKCLKEIFRNNYFKNVQNKEFYHKNKIEIKTEEWLKNNNIKCKYNYILDKLFQYDFIVNDNILIEVQGNFWHANPKIYKTGPIYEQQKERVNNDKIKLKYALDKGYKIYYIWEDDINKNNFSSLYELLKS